MQVPFLTLLTCDGVVLSTVIYILAKISIISNLNFSHEKRDHCTCTVKGDRQSQQISQCKNEQLTGLLSSP